MSQRPILLVTLSLLLLGVACGSSSDGDSTLRTGTDPTGTATPTPLPSLTVTASTPGGSATAGTGSATAQPIISTSGHSSETQTTAPASPSSPAMLTESSSGTTVRIRAGQSIEVSLPGGANGGYTQPASSSDSIARRTSARGGYPTNQPAQATFLGVKPGTADLAASTDFACLHSTPQCLPPQRQWLVHLVVTA